ncbi:MAG: hypothetical protein JWO36_1584 [Myxococcales bacterium]|nr:hypothetical protein [Myxococcales bacterium]
MVLGVTGFRDQRCHHLVVADAIAEERAAALREQIDAAGFAPFYEPDRARCEINCEHSEPALFDELRGLAERICERPLRVARARWLRLRHRDYALLKADARDRIEETHVEVMLDLSARATEQADVIYTDGRESWVVAQRPRSVVVVEREPWLFRYERYLNVQVQAATVYRLRLALLFG